MGLFDFVGDILGTQNKSTAQAQTVGTANRDYYKPASQDYWAGDQKNQYLQEQFLNQLLEQSQGRGPSVAESMANHQSDQSLANSMAMANSARGDLNPAMVYRNALKNAAAQKAQSDANAQVMRQQEMLNANNLYGQNLSSARGTDTNMLQFYEQLGMQGDLGNMGSANQAQGLNLGISEANKQRNQQLVGGLISGAGQIGAASAGRPA
jgi:hypothetical protein